MTTGIVDIESYTRLLKLPTNCSCQGWHVFDVHGLLQPPDSDSKSDQDAGPPFQPRCPKRWAKNHALTKPWHHNLNEFDAKSLPPYLEIQSDKSHQWQQPGVLPWFHLVVPRIERLRSDRHRYRMLLENHQCGGNHTGKASANSAGHFTENGEKQVGTRSIMQ